jgi:hydrogenase/urease accessory protein HupE
MTRLVLACAAVLWLAALPADAHPIPFSYVDVRLEGSAINLTLVVHDFDLAHDLGLATPERLLDPASLDSYAAAIVKLLEGRLTVEADGRVLVGQAWAAPEAIPERQSVRLQRRYDVASVPGALTVTARMFPYDPVHQTFVNIYEQGEISAQAILDGSETRYEYLSGTRQGAWAAVRKFVPSGVHHILIGPDHILFLVGLLLVGGSMRQLLLVVTSFTVAHSITLSLAALGMLNPPARLVEPAIALSIVYVGADNLLVKDGRDVRAWIAFAFGFIHGFGFAYVLRDMGLPTRALGWSLFSFNLGVEIGQLLVVVLVAVALRALRARSEVAGQRLAFAGSILVIAAGAFWFIQRVFFPGGMA